MSLKFEFYRYLVKSFYNHLFDLEIHYNNFDPDREDAYILVGNHPCLHDGVYISPQLKKPPAPIINTFMFTSKIWKFVLTKIYPSIAKRKGQNDIITVRAMMQTIHDGRGVMLFPEGNASYYGEQSEIPYSTVKFMKKMKKDIVVIKTNGAYLVAPRWGKKRIKKGLLEIHVDTLIKGKELENFTTDEIYDKIKEAIKFNDFDWNRKKMHEYKPKHRALGLERFMYVCPICKSHQTIHTKGNTIYCKQCGEIAHFNEYCLLEGLEFDNLVDWGNLQHKEIPRLANLELHTSGLMFDVDVIKYKSKKIGNVELSLSDNVLHVQHRKKEYRFVLEKIKGLTLTRKDEVSFDFEEKTYFIKMKDPMLFFEIIKYKIGG